MKVFQKISCVLLAVLLISSMATFSSNAAAVTVTGDANGNGVTNIIDLIHLKKSIVDNDSNFYDMDGDFVPSATDLVIMRQLLLDRYAVVYRVYGEQHALQFYTEGEKVVRPTNPYVQSMVFTGWDGLPGQAPANVTVVKGLFQADYELPIIK